MRQIPLTKGKVALVDNEDYESLKLFKWHATQSAGGQGWYATRNVPNPGGGQTKIKMHRVILGVTGNVQVDHLNGDGLDNQRSNLRPATNTQNQYNRRVNHRLPKNKYKGVVQRSGGRHYAARVIKDGRQFMSGLFLRAEDAAKEYDRMAREMFGEFACTNFPTP